MGASGVRRGTADALSPNYACCQLRRYEKRDAAIRERKKKKHNAHKNQAEFVSSLEMARPSVMYFPRPACLAETPAFQKIVFTFTGSNF